MAAVRRRREAVFQHLDEVGREHSYSSWIASQPSHPPETIASIECFDEVALDKAQVAFRLAAPRVRRPDPAGKTRGQIGWSAHGVVCMYRWGGYRRTVKTVRYSQLPKSVQQGVCRR